jgi:hypothetical protein
MFFVKDDNHIMNAYLKRFFQTTGTPEALTCSTVELFIGKNPEDAATELPSDMRLTPCAAEDEITVAHAAQRCFGAHAAAAVSFVPGELSLPDSQARFAQAGLERTRDCVLLRRGDRIAYALLEETASPGVNLTWMLNAVWILPVHPDADTDGKAFEAALRVVNDKPAQSPTGERFLNLPAGLSLDALSAAGFAREASLRFYVLNRAGLHRLFHYTAVRCGEVEALVQKRQSRRARRPEGNDT